MKSLILITSITSAILFLGCKKDAPPPLPKDNPHAGMDMSSGKSDPHAGMDMGATKSDPHAGMNMGAAPADPHTQINPNQNMGGMFGAPTPEMKAQVTDGKITIGKLHGKLPTGWKSVPPSSAMRLAQMELPANSGDPESGELTVFYLGTDAGGVEANIERWCAQFGQPDGKPTKDIAKREEIVVGSLKATLVKFTGTMSGSTMPGVSNKGQKDNWMNLSAIVMTPEGPFFFKGTGPVKTMQAQESAMKDFIKSLSFGG